MAEIHEPPGEELNAIYARLRILEKQMGKTRIGVPSYSDSDLGAIQDSFGPGAIWINLTDGSINWIDSNNAIHTAQGQLA